MHFRSTWALLIAVAGVSLAAAGCGSGDDRSSTNTSSAKTTKAEAKGGPKVVVMPDLTGVGVYEAQCRLAKAGLRWSIDGRAASNKPEANCSSIETAAPIPNPTIAAQKPKPGTKLLQEGTIGLATTCANQRAPKDGPYCIPGQPGSP